MTASPTTRHCTCCHGTFEPEEHLTWEYETSDRFGLCAPCNTESYGSGAWALSVGAVEDDEMDSYCSCLEDCKAAEYRIWGAADCTGCDGTITHDRGVDIGGQPYCEDCYQAYNKLASWTS